MTTRKKLTAVLTTCMMLGGTMTCFPASAEETMGTYEAMTYTNYGDYIAITDCDESVTEVVIPAEIDGVPVTTIGRSAFSTCTQLSSVTIPEGVTTIASHAFGFCDALTEIKLPSTIIELEDYALANCGITEVTLPENLETLNSYVFQDCENLTDVYVSASVTFLLPLAFDGCLALETIHVSEDNPMYASVDGVLLDKFLTTIWWYPAAKKDTVYSMPDSVCSLGSQAFSNCQYLTTLNIPADFYENALGLCIMDCLALTEYVVAEENKYLCSIDGVLYNEERTELILYPASKAATEFVVPDGVETIDDWAFINNKNLVSVTIPEGVTHIGEWTFSDSAMLQTIVLPEGLLTIEDHAFFNCKKLENTTIPSTVTEIVGAFGVCSSMTSFVYPEGVTVIHSFSHAYCDLLESVYIPKNVTLIEDYAFNGSDALTDIYYGGSEADWAAITIEEQSNNPLFNATIHYNCTPTGDPRPEPTIADVDGDGVINSSDAAVLLIAAAASGTGADSGLTDAQIKAADLNGDGALDAVDASIILRYAAYAGTGGTESISDWMAANC